MKMREEEEITPAEKQAMEDIEQDEIRRATALMSPEAIVMFPIALILDLFGVVCLILYLAFGIGLPLSYIPDVIGIIVIGGWSLMRSQSLRITRPRAPEVKRVKKRAQKRIAKIERRIARSAKWAKRLRWLRPLLIVVEFIPFLGDIAFSWTLMVYFELKS